MKPVTKKKSTAKRVRADEILPEYDFSRGVRNEYIARYARGCAVVGDRTGCRGGVSDGERGE